MRKSAVIVGVAIAILAGTLGYLWMKAATDSYDQRFDDCMRVEQRRLYPQGHYWPTDPYNAAMYKCAGEAGAPKPDKGNPGSWRWP